ncbi:sugar nucleotide-binding protein [Lysinibacillus sp. NPDC093190]|uniref:sugar nucleotide-binding protein n=1 Tax=Lysinibacillus sp. NPDC093190 TaxID=3390575 RepID=UPI003CFC892D
MNKILILGASGLIGKAIIEEYKNDFDLYGTYSSSITNLPREKQFQLDITQIDRFKKMLKTINPDIVISCLRGDFNQQLEFHKQLATELKNSKGILYYFSTANVFDGDFSKPHFESDSCLAESDYGSFKIKCENTLQQIIGERAIIIRIPAIWGKNSPRMNLIKKGIEDNQVIDVYSNLECNNLLDTQLAKQLKYIIDNKLKGIFHLGSIDTMTQATFFERLINGLSDKKGYFTV